MSTPNPKTDREEFYYELHIKAGLVPAGKNDDGEQEWIGTDRQWSDYDNLEVGVQEDIQF